MIALMLMEYTPRFRKLWGIVAIATFGQTPSTLLVLMKTDDRLNNTAASEPEQEKAGKDTNLDQSVGGIAWEHQASTKRKRMAEMEACTSSVEGDPMYSDGVKTYVISREKMEREGLKKPVGEKEMKMFFKKHADKEIIDEKDVPSEKVDVASATEKDGSGKA
ncbi:hypothetical protein LTR50_006062 [Elasticomyces elasticus]|nr:hypothetical protein LTR50_006062 [Elasticomyces elasticus]